ncbi:MAG TPA: Rieske 2Fe-2S domain-containing protein [Actinomycetota bacterium]|nr:Rieske 2Fe-2S domain-containing protein [Actinomycetota bacterium]
MAVRIVVALAVVLAGIGFLLLATYVMRRRPRETVGPSGTRVVRGAAETAPPPPAPVAAGAVPDSPEVQVNRRMFLNRVLLLSSTVFGVGMGGGSLAMLWPNKIGGFGSVIDAGNLEDIKKRIADEKQPYYNAEGRFYLVAYTPPEPDDNPYVEAECTKEGIMALYQKCAHLGCRVPFCVTSQWFECPCHGSVYNGAGEVQPNSPAPAGLWRFKMTIDGGRVLVDTSKPLAQPAKGADTVVQPPAGPHCLAAGGGGH